MLDDADTGVGWAVVVASQHVLILGTEAGIVGHTTCVDLALDDRDTCVEDAGILSAVE